MKHNQILAISLLCTLLASSFLVGLWALPRVSLAYAYAAQFAGLKGGQAGGAEGTNMSLMLYGDPTSLHQVFDAGDWYFTAQNLEWKGAVPNPQGPPVNIGLIFEYAEFKELDPDRCVLNVTNLHISVSAGDLLNLVIEAEDGDAQIEFWWLNGLPALNITAVLTGSVNISLSTAVLPLPGLWGALYEYKGERFVISICMVKPIDVTIVNPNENAQVKGDVKIEASIQTAPGISLDGKSIWWWIEHEKWGSGRQPMMYNKTSGLWEAVWRTYTEPAMAGNGWCRLAVRAEGIEVNKPGEFRQGDEKRINVEVANSPLSVRAYVETEQGREELSGLNINWWYEKEGGTWQTPFELSPRIDYTLEAPGEWGWKQGRVGFRRWLIEDEDGNTIFESWGTKIQIDRNVFRMLFDSQGNPRELKCIYAQF